MTSGLRTRAWGVHFLTASGSAIGLLALMACARGDFEAASLWMLVAFVIDSVDGALARKVGVAEVLPGFDGRRLDDIVDFLNYVIVPAFMLVQADLVPHWGWAAVPVIASAYGFSQANAKTDDNFFLGFPSYWNIVAIYAWLLQAPHWVVCFFIGLLSALVFLPLKYLYPSRMVALGRPMIVATGLWLASLALLVVLPSQHGGTLAKITLALPVLYFVLSAWMGGWWQTIRERLP